MAPENDERLRIILEQMPAIVWTVDRELRFTSGAGAGLARLGLAPNQLVGVSLFEYFGTADPDFAPIAAHRRALGGEAGSARISWADRSFDYHVEPLREPGGAIAGAIGIAFDVTERTRAEAELKETQEFNREVVTSAREGIIVYDRELRYRVWNPFMEELTDLSADKVLGRPAADVFPFLAEQGVLALVARALAGETVQAPDYRFEVPSTGRHGWASATYGPHRNASGAIVGAIGVVRDVTQRREAERKLAERIQFERLLASLSNSFINIKPADLDGAITSALEKIARFASADASYVYLLSDDGERASLTHGYRSPALSEPKTIATDLAVSAFPWAFSRLASLEPLIVPDVAALPPEAKSLQAMLAPNDVRSFVVVPISTEGRLTGIVGFSLVGEGRHWPEDSIALLTLAGELLSNAIERRRTEQALRASEERYRLLFERNLAGVYRTTLDGRILDCNDACARIFGYESREDLLAQRASEVYFDPTERDAIIARLQSTGNVVNSEVCFQRRDGGPVWVLENVSLLREDGEPVLEGTIIDISDRKRAERQLAYQAHHDQLTELPNRVLFQDRLLTAIAQARRARRGLAVIFLDLDHFKQINDTLGHSAGDRLLQAVAERLKGCLREGDTVARFGGDEFTLLLQEINRRDDATRVATKLLEAIRRPLDLAGHTILSTGSLGIALFPADGQDPEALLKEADRAMYRAKDAGRNTHAFAKPAPGSPPGSPYS